MDRTPKTHQKHQKPTKKDTQLIQNRLKDKGAEQFLFVCEKVCVLRVRAWHPEKGDGSAV